MNVSGWKRSSRKVLCLALLLPGAASCVGGEGDALSLLYVHHSNTMEYADGTLTLAEANPLMLFFSDRPNRVFGHIKMRDFVSLWGQGEESFEAVPPNATLSVSQEHAAPLDAVVVLTNPRLSGTSLQYDIELLEGIVPSSGGASVLFIDNRSFIGDAARGVGAPGAAVAGDTEMATGGGTIHHVVN